MEGEAAIAERQTHYADDGVIDKQERKELDKAHKRQLESRGRGPAQIRAYRTSKWMMRVCLSLLHTVSDLFAHPSSAESLCRSASPLIISHPPIICIEDTQLFCCDWGGLRRSRFLVFGDSS